MKKYYMLIFTVITVCICVFMLFLVNKINTREASSSNIEDNSKICWGLKRESNNKQPSLHKPHTDVLDKYNGIYMGNSEDKYLYLTFDEGYENGYTPQILDVLKENNVKAAFFITGDYLKTSPDIVERIIKEGHILGNHTQTHPSLPKLANESKIQKELKTLEEKIYSDYGYKMKYFRPPMGEYSKFTLKCVSDIGYTTVMWSFAYDDWDVNKQKGIDYAKDKIMSNLHPGSIILLHAVSKDNANVLDYVIKEARNQGYEFKSLDEFKK